MIFHSSALQRGQDLARRARDLIHDRRHVGKTQQPRPARSAGADARCRGHVGRRGLVRGAALLKEQGYDVVGVTMQLYDQGEAEHRPGACCAGQDIFDARQAAALIGIPHYVLDYETRFRTKVIDAFAQSYAEGETPIPCVTCNQQIKFVDLFDMARDLGADALATGHYIISRADGEDRALFRARDAERDQSYFLFATTREQLKLLRFPLGEMTKPEVREHARRFGLAIADKPDSQDICFVPPATMPTSWKNCARRRPRPATSSMSTAGARPPRGGDALHHRAAARPWPRRGGATAGEPLYVVKIDAAHARVTVGPREALATRRVAFARRELDRAVALSTRPSRPGWRLAVRVRSTRPPAPALLEMRGRRDLRGVRRRRNRRRARPGLRLL